MLVSRRRFLALTGAGALGVLSGETLAAPGADSRCRVMGNYGFLTCFAEEPEPQTRARIATMAGRFGVREFQLYDWFADYATPVAGAKWTDPYFHRREICRRTLEVYTDEIHRHGGRAWAYVQAVGAEETNLADPAKDILKLVTAKGEWYWHPPGVPQPRFPTYFANAAWAEHMVARWAPAVKQLGFDGIHWDTLGRIAGDYGAETVGMHAFIRRAQELLRPFALQQTFNFVDLAWWDRALVRSCLAFPYSETWTAAIANQYYAEMDSPDMAGVGGVFAMYPSEGVPAGWTETDVICARWREAPRHRLVYLVIGDGARRMKNQYWPETIPLTDTEIACLTASRHGD